MTRKHTNGFSLIELMITIGVISILGTIAYPSYTSQVMKMRRSDAYTGLMQSAALQERWFTSNNSYTGDINNIGGTSSPEGNYTLTVTTPSCISGTYISCFIITATSIGNQASDTECTSLSINQLGVKTATGGGDCW